MASKLDRKTTSVAERERKSIRQTTAQKSAETVKRMKQRETESKKRNYR